VWPPVVGSQSALGGGGRYDGLAEQLGGRPTPGVGWASGIERVIMELKQQQVVLPEPAAPRAYFAYMDERGKRQAFRLAATLRAAGVSAELAFGDRKLGKQLSAADKVGAHLALILGEDELANGTITIKDLRNGGQQRTIPQRDLLQALSDGTHGATD
jgi:histidyl-tRNA synthetase